MSDDRMTQRVEDRYWLATVDDEGVRLRAGEETARAEFRAWLAKHNAQVRAETLREAADVIHAEARWQMEQKIRGAVQKSGAETAVERFVVLEQLLRERAALIEKEADQ